MTVARWWSFARKAVHRPPRYVAVRAWHEAQRQARRPWGRIRPGLLTDAALLKLVAQPSLDAQWEAMAATPFFLHATDRPMYAAGFGEAFPAEATEIIDAAGRLLLHEFDLLGSGRVALGPRLPWHEDFKTGRRWPVRYAPDIDYNDLDQPSDVKVPWELSRCQHLPRIGQAYWLTGDERYAHEFVSEIQDWIAQNPWLRGVNWACTMDVALRAVSWIWAFHFFANAPACASHEFRSAFVRALWLHGEFIAANLEVADVNGNHYLTDGVGLVFLGALFHGTSAGEKWLRLGRSIVTDEMQSQVWPDGVDFEQSIAYHRLVLEAFSTSYLLIERSGGTIPVLCRERLERMFAFVAAYIKPDGLAPLIGDADDGRIQVLGTQAIGDHRYLASTGAVMFKRSDIKGAAVRCWPETFWLLGPAALADFDALELSPPRSGAFPDSGFYVMRGGNSHAIVDCGDVGMRGRGGHGHNDVLGFELTLDGVNVITDCGAYLYTSSREWRNRFRSTAFHNVLEIDGEELNRFVDPDDLWRLEYDAVPFDVTWRTDDTRAVLSASHQGYERLPSPVIHRRTLALDWTRSVFVLRDAVTGKGRHVLTWRFHLEPEITVSEHDNGWRLAAPNGRSVWLQAVDVPSGMAAEVVQGWVSPSYGRRMENAVLTFRAESHVPVTFTCLVARAPLDATGRRAALEWLEIDG